MVQTIVCAVAALVVALPAMNAWAAPDDDPCPIVGCGSNAPHLTEPHLGQLNLDGERNSYGVRIEHLLVNGLPYRLAIEDGGFVGHRPGGRTIAGPALVGGEIVITRTESDGEESRLRILVADLAMVRTWDDTRRGLPVYHLKIDRAGDGTWSELCHHPPEIDMEDGIERWSTPVLGRYSYRELAPVAGSRERGWFNIACAGQAFFKMKRHGYDDADHSDDQRQATLRMITAAYCPGVSWNYTLYGTHIYWQNRAGDAAVGELDLDARVSWVSDTRGVLEAVWNRDGATCLNTPRVEKAELPAVIEGQNEALLGQVSSPCSANPRKAIPRCTVRAEDSLRDVLARHGGEWITVTPVASPSRPTPPRRPRSGCAGCSLGAPEPIAGGAWLVLLLMLAAARASRRCG